MMRATAVALLLFGLAVQDPAERAPSHVEHVVRQIDFPVSTRRFDPPLDVRADREPANAAAYVAARASLRAMLEQRFDDWLDAWDDASQRTIRARLLGPADGFPRRTREQWLTAWESLATKAAVIVAEGTCPTFTVFAFELRNPDATVPPGERGFGMTFDEGGVLRGRIAVRQQPDGTWRRTNAFDAHPVLLTWFTAETVIRMPAQAADWEPPTARR